MARTRRRGSRYTWLPTDPTFYQGADGYPSSYYWTTLTSDVDNVDREVLAVPILPDYTTNTASAATGEGSLRDIVEGQDYVLKRTVGKVWGSLEQDVAGTAACILACGIAVLPVTDSGDPTLTDAQMDPLNADNSMNPWMFRRTWILHNNLLTGGVLYLGPNSIGGYGSVMDGGHVDVKVARRVTREQRIFAIWTAATLQYGGDEQPTIGNLVVGFDFRFLGAMRRHKNRSTFS